ncbi:transcriptional regulator [Kiloniella spongiae]|uniref:Transcriptional regulator n=1 Tax=Kiloniella spongiae TaxID=1489064 RepID=A0A0H2MHC7_9PROT|nr:helix-turn-helix domain-containing protein [Kiloniella spongiae]KLN60152.1 transcriptional regulator [Kiloniella spongiae]
MTSIPIPGKPVRGSKSGDPIMALFDLLGRRWAMGILWTLCKTGPSTFRELQSQCGTISPTVLNTRLKELREAQLLHHDGDGYQATKIGQELYGLLRPIGEFSSMWADIISDVESK